MLLVEIQWLVTSDEWLVQGAGRPERQPRKAGTPRRRSGPVARVRRRKRKGGVIAFVFGGVETPPFRVGFELAGSPSSLHNPPDLASHEGWAKYYWPSVQFLRCRRELAVRKVYEIRNSKIENGGAG